MTKVRSEDILEEISFEQTVQKSTALRCFLSTVLLLFTYGHAGNSIAALKSVTNDAQMTYNKY